MPPSRRMTRSMSGMTPEELQQKPKRVKQSCDEDQCEQKRAPEDDQESKTEQNIESQKDKKRSPSDDLICPITHQLPWDPVTAEDGQVYEREAIEQHIKSRENQELRSPITNVNMGNKLYPAPKIKNLIETLIDSGVITGDIADTWIETRDQQRKKEKLIKDANSGGVNAMLRLALNYDRGANGFRKDVDEAVKWMKKSHCAGATRATAWLGWMYFIGEKVEKCTELGLMYMSMAAAKGSRKAAYNLGRIFTNEIRWGLPTDKALAIYWLETCLVTRIDNLSDDRKEKARALLQMLKASKTK